MIPGKLATPPEDSGWYYCTVTDRGGQRQWINRAHLVRMYANGAGGTTLVDLDGNATNVAETIDAPAAAVTEPDPAQPPP